MFPRHHWRGSIEALRPNPQQQPRARFRAIIGAAPLKLDVDGELRDAIQEVSAPSLARLH